MRSRTSMPLPRPDARRFKIRFPDDASFEASAAPEIAGLPLPVSNPKRRYRAVSLPFAEAELPAAERRLDAYLQFLGAEYGATVEMDEQYQLDLAPRLPCSWLRVPPRPSLDDVLDAIGARAAWAESCRGDGAVIAVVDSGIDGRRREIPSWKRYGSWQIQGAMPFTDPFGHGTMCAVIAAGCREAGGRFAGVAPGARLVACRTRFFDSELTAIYDHLIGLAAADPSLRLIATNSFGHRTGSEPAEPQGDFPAALEEAVAHGIAIFFSAGNNHELTGGGPRDCHPPSIWSYKLRPDVFTVGACDLDGQLWDYSSRGAPGSRKPDLVAPTPREGLIAFGAEEQLFAAGWGTSGACPQAAGLAALLWTAEPSLEVSELFERIRAGARDLGLPWSCQGAGALDCAASLQRLEIIRKGACTLEV